MTTNLEQEAREAAKIAFGDCAGRYPLNEEKWREGFLAAAEPREKEIAALRAELADWRESAREAAVAYRDKQKAALLTMRGLDPERPLRGSTPPAEAHFIVQEIDHVCSEIRRAHLAGAESREKEIASLRARVAELEGGIAGIVARHG